MPSMSSTKLLLSQRWYAWSNDSRRSASALQVTEMLISIFGTSKTLGHRWNRHPARRETTEHREVTPDCSHGVKLTPSWPPVRSRRCCFSYEGQQPTLNFELLQPCKNRRMLDCDVSSSNSWALLTDALSCPSALPQYFQWRRIESHPNANI